MVLVKRQANQCPRKRAQEQTHTNTVSWSLREEHKQFSEERIIFQQMGLRQQDIHMQK